MVSVVAARFSQRGLTANTSRNDMANSVEEEEFADNERLDKHNRASCDDGKKGHDVEDSNNVENHVAWTSQRLFEENHLAEDLRSGSLTSVRGGER